MISSTFRSIAIALVIGLCCASIAHAGRSCEPKKVSVQSIDQGLALAEKTMATLDATQADVVLLGRAGQDLSKYGLRYSHLSFAFRQPDGKGGHVWRVVHKLNQCGTATSSLYRQGLAEFFLDDPWRHEAAYVVPSRAVQQQLLTLLQDEAAIVRLHHRPYSIVSYAWGIQYQQSNQWVTETLARALAPGIDPRERAQAWLMLRDYQPSTLHLGALTRLGGRMSASNVSFDDHPSEKRFSDRIETVTVDSVFHWLDRTGMGARAVVVTLP